MRRYVRATSVVAAAIAVGFAMYGSDAFKVAGIALSWIAYIAVLLAPIGIPLVLWLRGRRRWALAVVVLEAVAVVAFLWLLWLVQGLSGSSGF